MISSRQRAHLRGCANGIPAIFQIGKGGITPAVIKQVEEALAARELIKLSVLETALLSAREAAETISEKTGADVVQTIGNKLVLYHPNPSPDRHDKCFDI